MVFFGAALRGLHRRPLRFGVGALAFTFVTCRTPPPLPKAPSEASEAPTERAAKDENPPVRTAEPAVAPEAQPAAASRRDYSEEHRELAELYAKRKALSTLRGEASYYGRAFAGRKTASGEPFEPARYTAAHRTLPFGTVLRVSRVGTRQVVYVRVNDRGPFGKRRRIIDLSEAAADELGMLRDGVCQVRVEVLERGKKR
jgi:rare lipoprotein A